ncbi:MAG: hypothetical protein WC444_05575 [Candidatus Paceibacterota bacterium]
MNQPNEEPNKPVDKEINESPQKKILDSVVNNGRITISRIPENTKKQFIDISNEYFCGDYGMTIKFFIDQAIEYQIMKERLVDLGSMEERLSNLESEVEMMIATTSIKDPKEEGPKMLNGRTLGTNNTK